MSRGQRMVLAAIGGVIVVVLVAMGVTAIVRDADEARLAVGGVTANRGDDDSSPVSTDTTVALVPVTGGAALPTTTQAPPPKPPPPPPVTSGAPTTAPAPATTAAPAVGAAGALLKHPAAGVPARPVDKAKGCYSAVDPGWKVAECGALKRDDMVLLWVVESRGKALRALVLREQTAGQWALVLEAQNLDGAWTRIGVRGEDVSGDGRPDLVFGFHSRNEAGVIVADVVEAAVVTLSRRLAGPTTSVRTEKGALHTWQSAGDASGSVVHETLRVIGGAWRVAASEAGPKASVPPSMV